MLASSSSALADEPVTKPVSDCAKARAEHKTCVIVLDDVPEPPPIAPPVMLPPTPLIRIPKHFISEMMKSLEDF